MKYRIFSFLILTALCLQIFSPFVDAAELDTQTATQDQVTAALLEIQENYPDGMVWTNNNPSPAYTWVFPGSIVAMSGCAYFAAILQDTIFGSIKERPVTWQRITKDCPTRGIAENPVPYSWEKLWPGDILQFSGHVVIVVQKFDDHISIAEGNYGGKVKWGRIITKEGVNTAAYVLTRYSKTELLMTYPDLPNPTHWSFAAITWALKNNIADPITSTSFAPKASCSRADMIYFLWAAAGCPEPEAQDLPFSDVSASANYYKAVLWALQQGVTSGTSQTSFSPDASCSRAQALTFLWRSEGSPAAETKDVVFDDVDSDKYYFTTVSWAAEHHITSGTSASTFSPNRTISRAEALTFLYNANNS